MISWLLISYQWLLIREINKWQTLAIWIALVVINFLLIINQILIEIKLQL